MLEITGYSMEELAELVGDLARQYAGVDSTSITYEKAQQLMEAVMYCIREYEEQGEKGDFPAESGRVSAREAYHRGLAIVTDKVQRLRNSYNSMIGTFDDYGNQCLRDTVEKGIPEFLKWYDVRYCPQDTILTLDYPVLEDLSRRTGIDAVLEYMECIVWEQGFLKHFDLAWVRRRLDACLPEAGIQVINLCEVLFPYLVNRVREWKVFDETEL